MISFVLGAALPLTLLLLIIIGTRQLVLTHFGCKQSYQLWLTIPILLLATLVPEHSKITLAVAALDTVQMTADVSDMAADMNWRSLITSLYLVGLTLSLIVLFRQIFIYRSLIQYLWELPEAQLAKPLRDSKVRVVQCKHTESAYIIGLFSPTLVLPGNFFSDFNLNQQQAIVEHELIHAKRHDILCNVLASIILLLFWFHPLVWFAFRLFRQDQELSCDHAVVVKQSLTYKQDYARALLISNCNKTTVILQIPFISLGEKKMLKERINNIHRKSRRKMALSSKQNERQYSYHTIRFYFVIGENSDGAFDNQLT